MHQKVLFSIAEAATALGIGRTSIYNLMKAGELQTVKLGSRTLIKASSLDDLISRSEVGEH